MKRYSDYRKFVVNFDSSKEITRAFEKEFQGILILETSLENDCSFYFVKTDKIIKVGEFDYHTTETIIKDFKRLTKEDLNKVDLYLAFLVSFRKKIFSYKKKNNLPDSLWDDFLNHRIELLNNFLNRGTRERKL